MADHNNSADHSDENSSSHTLSTEPGKPQQLHTSPSDGNMTSATQSTQHLNKKEVDMEKGKEEPPKPAPAMPNGKEKDPNVVGWEGMVFFLLFYVRFNLTEIYIIGPDDPQNPQNWPKSKKYVVTVLYAILTFTLTFSSSIFSTATLATSKEFGVSTEVMTLGTSLIVLVRLTFSSLLNHGFR